MFDMLESIDSVFDMLELMDLASHHWRLSDSDKALVYSELSLSLDRHIDGLTTFRNHW